MGIFRSIGRTLAMPYVKTWDGAARIGRALGSVPGTARDGRRQTDELASRADKPMEPTQRFEWYCRELGLTEGDLAQRAVNFQMVRRIAVVATVICLLGAAVMVVLRHWFFCVTDLVVGMTFVIVALRNAYYLHQVLNREIITLRAFFSRPSLFSEWFSWRRR
jgi:hypothetical protein